MNDLKTKALEVIGLWAHDELCLGGPECDVREALHMEEVEHLYQQLTEAGLLRTENMFEIEDQTEFGAEDSNAFSIFGISDAGKRVLLMQDEAHGDALFHVDLFKQSVGDRYDHFVIEERL